MPNQSRVELVRLRLGLTKSGFAEALGVDRKTLQRFESGYGELPLRAVERLCEISGFRDEFFKKGDPEYPNFDGVSFRSLRSLTAAKRDKALAAAAIAFELDDWIHKRFALPEHDLRQMLNRTPMEAA